MSKLFKNYEECESVIIIMSEDLSDKSLKNIVLAMNVSASLLDDKDKIYRLTQTYRSALWDIPEAISQGFHKYLRINAEETKKMLSYHKKHCPKDTTCKVCSNKNKMLIRMRNVNERKEPQIYNK